MKKTLIALCAILAAATVTGLSAKVRVVATYPYIGDIVKQIGGDKVEVFSLAPGSWDPHRVVPRPSLIARVRGANLLVLNGADLEAAWLTPLVDESNNAAVRRGSRGYLDLSAHVRLIDVPKSVSRALGDVHPHGNPHFHLDPDNIPLCAKAVCDRLCALDPGNATEYRSRFEEFAGVWSHKCAEWEARMAERKGGRVVQYHTLYNYLLKKYGITSAVSIERYPGVPPASRHIGDVIAVVKRDGVKTILISPYDPKGPPRLIAKKTGARIVVVPHDVNAVKRAEDIIGLFEAIVGALCDD